jgi:hypothetical protein
MIDGEENFRLKYQKMNEAKKQFIANYDLDPNLRLIRGDAMPRSLQIHGLIASLCGSESLESNAKNSTSGIGDSSIYDSFHDGDLHSSKSFDKKSKTKSRY